MAKPKVRIVFCEGCKWALRAGWYAQELFSTFHGQLSSIELVVGESGQFQVWAGETRLWDRKEQGGFPDIAELKRLLRDCIAPDVSLGHCDLPVSESGE